MDTDPMRCSHAQILIQYPLLLILQMRCEQCLSTRKCFAVVGLLM
jgi:hypothetical protein